ncbi:hypothetical protein [Streptomyces winkii]|uniref:hypothetical protein n=1 Tax=Streptomyces winkii TaxID=3051178 RepID=UPI0028D61F82|nr:hypothetical protein [Streptomyces sp. DSM 40971]
MTGWIRPLPVRRALVAAGVAVTVWLVWRLISGAAPSAAAMAAVLGWGLGLVPVHVTLDGPHERAGRRRIRRPAQSYEMARERRTRGREGRVRW